MIYLVVLFMGVAFGQRSAEDEAWVAAVAADENHACRSGDFEINGRFTGQNIAMDYGRTSLSLDDSGATPMTKLDVMFLVPKIYTAQYEAAAFAITFNREHDLTDNDQYAETFKNQVTAQAEEAASTNQNACYTNRYLNSTYCNMSGDGAGDGGANGWTIGDNGENECVSDVSSSIPWADVMGDSFANVVQNDNGEFWEIFMTATVETWSHFREGYDRDLPIDQHNYAGQMQGKEELANNPAGNGAGFDGLYSGDGGKGVTPPNDPSMDFGPLLIDDERYTMYQIPFIIRFPKTIIVETEFTSASPLQVVTGVVKQDTINVNLNPAANEVFAELEVTVRTEVQYPYAISSPDLNDDGPETDTPPMTVCVRGALDGATNLYDCDTTAGVPAIDFVHYNAEQSCGGKKEGEYCHQDFKMRITPDSSNPCSVAGDYVMRYWVECVIDTLESCPVDDLINAETLDEQRTSNAYFETVFTVEHQSFCPEIMDEVRVVGDFTVFHDEAFTMPIKSVDNANDLQAYSNDVLFYLATYRTASQTVYNSETFEDNDFTSDPAIGNDVIIDYVRATEITMEVSLNKARQNSPGVFGEGDVLNAGMTNANTPFGNSPDTIDGALAGFGSIDMLDGGAAVSDVTFTGGLSDWAQYKVLLCYVNDVPMDVVEPEVAGDGDLDGEDDVKANDCFTNVGSTADLYLDFDKVITESAAAAAAGETAHDVKEKEVAFKFRLDERIIPITPETDGSWMKMTIQSEIYYKGNLHPTRRRLLQESPRRNARQQRHAMDLTIPIEARGRALDICHVDPEEKHVEMMLQLHYTSQKNMPNVLNAMSWSSGFSMQLNAFYTNGVKSIGVRKVDRCDGETCITIMDKGRQPSRRLQDGEFSSHVNVFLTVDTLEYTRAGALTNTMQGDFADRSAEVHSSVSILVDSNIHTMKVMNEGCSGHEAPRPPVAAHHAARPLDESSAYRAPLAILSLLAFLLL